MGVMPNRNAVLICIALSVAGCRSFPSYMSEIDPARQLKAPADRALMVFVRGTSDDGKPVQVIDEQATFLGTALPGIHFSVVRPPGRQLFVVSSGTDDVLVADLAPGMVYFVEVSSAAGMICRPSRRGTELWPYKEQMIDETAQFRVDLAAAAEQTKSKLDARRQKVKESKDRLRGYSAAELAARTLAVTDGHVAVGIPGTFRVVAAPAPLPPPPPVPLPVLVQPIPVPALPLAALTPDPGPTVPPAAPVAEAAIP